MIFFQLVQLPEPELPELSRQYISLPGTKESRDEHLRVTEGGVWGSLLFHEQNKLVLDKRSAAFEMVVVTLQCGSAVPVFFALLYILSE